MSDIRVSDLIARFQYAVDNKWGYIWGTAGIKWTAEKQNAATREQTVKYGKQWIGHYVADCSGLFNWAFKQLGGTMYHGSNTMYNSWCVAKGKLKGGKRADGQPMKPGTAVFTGTESEHGHVGLYIGNGKVIEAQGTQAGVVVSSVTLAKWTYWGELKGVAYDGSTPEPEPEPAPTPEKGYAVVTGKNVALRQGPGTDCNVRLRVPTGKSVKLEQIPEGWAYVSYGGRTGFMMKEFLKE